MAASMDILLDDNDDLLIANGDLAVGESDYQHIRHIVRASKGEYKQFPLLGADIIDSLNGNADYEVQQVIKKQLRVDGYNVKSINFDNGELIIDAERV